MVFEPGNQKAAIVVLGYSYNTSEFTNVLRRKGLYTKFFLEEIEPQFVVNEDVPNKEQFINNFKNSFPIVSLKSTQNDIAITLKAFEQRLDINDNNFDPNNLDNLKSISNSLIDLRLSDISTIGINFIADFEFNKKLKLLNEKVEEIQDFKNNITFQLIIPIKYDDYIATYKIQKLILPDTIESNDEGRVYQVDVNFNLDFSDDSSRKKLERIEDALNNLKTTFYSSFYDKCQDFLGLHDE